MNRRKKKLTTAQKWMQGFISIAGNIAPVATVNFLVRQMFTLKTRPLKPAHVACINKAEKFSFDVPEFQNPERKLKLSCYSWGAGTKTVLLMHGWDARAIDFYKLIPVLVDSGYRVVSFDSPGHGHSEGEISHIIDFKEVLHKFILHYGKPYAIVGHSMGGAAAAFMLMEYDIKIEKLVIIAIPVVSKRFFDQMFSSMKVPMKMQKAFYAGYERELGESIEKYNLIERKETIKADNIFMIYDEFDEIAASEDVQEFLLDHPKIKTLNMKGVGHYSIIKDKHVISAITKFLHHA